MEWISTSLKLPELIQGKNYSENVLSWCDSILCVMCFCYICGDGGGFIWANCNGDINGDSEFDDDYNVTHWMPLPEPPCEK